MLLSRLLSFRTFRSLVVLLAAPLLLAACTLSPVYSDRGPGGYGFELAFSSPTSRLEQIVYQELAARFGRSTSPDALLVTIAVSSSAVTPGSGSVGLKGIITLTDPSGQIVFHGTRAASASYASSGQYLAGQQAANEAAERAAGQLAETIRVTLIGVLASLKAQNNPPATAGQ